VDDGLRTAGDLFARLENGAYTTRELYALARSAGLHTGRRCSGSGPGRAARFHRHVRNALQHAKRTGWARRLGQATWMI